nr:hypothetical protein [Streptococcus gallolyticus]
MKKRKFLLGLSVLLLTILAGCGSDSELTTCRKTFKQRLTNIIQQSYQK